MTITGNAIATRGEASSALAIRPGQDMWTDKQQAALSVLGIKDATNADMAVYMHVCQRTGLDPFTKQIYMLNRREKQGDQWVTKQTIQVGIDGFRVIRDRAAAKLGVDVEYEDTRWYDSQGAAYDVWLFPEPPAACRMAVLKGGKRYPGVLSYAEYVQTNREGKPTGKWRDAPAHQLEKCVEAFCLRRAFPNDLGGLLIEEEIPAGEEAPPSVAARVTAEEITSRPARPRQAASNPVAKQEVPASQPSSEASPPADPEDYSQDVPADVVPHALATGGQVGIIARHFKRLGFDEEAEREQRLAITATIAGTEPLESTKALTQSQAMAVQRTLERCKDRDQLIEMLATGEAPHE